MLCEMEVKQVVVSPVSSLVRLRLEWEDTGADLMVIRTPVALLLYDVCKALSLSADDTAEILGDYHGKVLA